MFIVAGRIWMLTFLPTCRSSFFATRIFIGVTFDTRNLGIQRETAGYRQAYLRCAGWRNRSGVTGGGKQDMAFSSRLVSRWQSHRRVQQAKARYPTDVLERSGFRGGGTKRRWQKVQRRVGVLFGLFGD